MYLSSLCEYEWTESHNSVKENSVLSDMKQEEMLVMLYVVTDGEIWNVQGDHTILT